MDLFFESLPASGRVLEAYAQFLGTIGSHSLPQAVVVIARRLRASDALKLLLNQNAIVHLEDLLRPLVYGRPYELKRHNEWRESVLYLLDQLVDAGSSIAYRMRDDFVTPGT